MYREIEMREKQIKIKKAIYGKNVFNSRIELAYYRKYETMKVHKSEIEQLHQAIGRAEGFIMCDNFGRRDRCMATPDRYRVCLDTTRLVRKTSYLFN